MKRGSFADRVASCLAQFRDVETRSTERSESHGMRLPGRQPPKPKD